MYTITKERYLLNFYYEVYSAVGINLWINLKRVNLLITGESTQLICNSVLFFGGEIQCPKRPLGPFTRPFLAVRSMKIFSKLSMPLALSEVELDQKHPQFHDFLSFSLTEVLYTALAATAALIIPHQLIPSWAISHPQPQQLQWLTFTMLPWSKMLFKRSLSSSLSSLLSFLLHSHPPPPPSTIGRVHFLKQFELAKNNYHKLTAV